MSDKFKANGTGNIDDDTREMLLRVLDRQSIKALLAQVNKLTEQIGMLQVVVAVMLGTLYQHELLPELSPELRAQLDELMRKNDTPVERAPERDLDTVTMSGEVHVDHAKGKDYDGVMITNHMPPVVVDCTGMSVDELAGTIADKIFENAPSNMPEEMEAQVLERAHEIAVEIVARRDAARDGNA